jgi:predicted Ser/Thr protein kinase
MTEKTNNRKESLSEIERRAKKLEALINVGAKLRERERRLPVPFNDFLYQASHTPECVFRNIFQLFHDMLHYYVPEGIDDFHQTDESVGFVHYDTHRLFVQNQDDPFFADRLFANRLMNLADDMKKGTNTNQIFLFEGPPGSGKSTFLNNLLYKLQKYTKTKEGTTYKIYWRLDIKMLGGFQHFERKMNGIADETGDDAPAEFVENRRQQRLLYPEKYLEFSCPNHDHPILLIPKSLRKDFLDELILDEEFKEKLFHSKEYEWVLKDIPCSICNSIYKVLMDEIGDPLAVFDMVNARKNYFNRQFGEGVSIFNPGDAPIRRPITNPTLQGLINALFKNDDVKYITSYLAKTNNGVLALMDIKEYNVERLKTFHGIISDGVHKVELSEERINTLFMGLVNPEDTKHYEKVKSFMDRIITVKIPYVLDYKTEVEIFRSKFGNEIEKMFLPRVLNNFGKIIIATRLNTNCTAIRKWLANPAIYSKYQDRDLLLLKMSIYTGKVPSWITDEDLKRFNKQARQAILDESAEEGFKGISGRRSIQIFNKFLNKHTNNGKLITMEHVKSFFQKSPKLFDEVPNGFIESLVSLYDYNVLQEVKEAIYHYNKKNIEEDIQDYIFALNFEIGDTKKSPYTGNKIDIDEDFLKNFEAIFLGTTSTPNQRKNFRSETHKEYVKKTLSQEINVKGLELSETEQFKFLFEKYIRNLKENALAPYFENENFRRAISDYGTDAFKKYDSKLKRDITRLIANLSKEFNYTEEGARQVSLYVVDKNLASKF